MTTILCTLYNSLYLDKGLVLYDSLCECTKDFKLYVLCMDDKCYEVLTDLHQEHHIPVRLSDFEEDDAALLEAKGNRSMGEYCWTCSSSFIRYVLKHFNEPVCTYIDADMYFYNDPQVLVDEMLEAGKSVMVVPHWLSKSHKYLENQAGKYCVEFNTFINQEVSLRVLDYWRERCLDCCSNLGDGIHWGDQKYLEELVDIFDCVYITTNHGAGMAPWNIADFYPLTAYNKYKYLPEDTIYEAVFYHFQSVTYINDNIVDCGVGQEVLESSIQLLYVPYLTKIKEKKIFLAHKYGLHKLIQWHPSSKGRLGWFRKTQLGVKLLVWKRKKSGRRIVDLKRSL